MASVQELWSKKENLEQWLNCPVLEVVLKDADLKGDNYMSNMVRMNVKTEEGDKALIVKCRLQNTEAAEKLSETSIFKREEEMYGRTLPKLDKILQEVTQGGCESLAPRCFYSCKDFLVMDDLTADGYKMQDRRLGMDLTHCLIVMRTLGRFHAASVVLHDRDPQSMRVYHESYFSETSSHNSHLKALTNQLIEELKTWPEAHWEPYIEKLRGIEDNFRHRIVKATNRNDLEYNVLTHCDLWTNNILFRLDEARLIDFQLTHYTSPVVDLMLFLITSPNMEVRTNHTDTLIQEYYRTLCSTLTALGSKKIPALEEIHQMLRNRSFYGLFALISEAAIMTADPNCGFNFEDYIKGKVPGRQMYSEFYKEIVKRELPILDSIGAFDEKLP